MSAVIILAAGEGSRMRSSTPKVLHRIAGRTLLGHAIAAARGTGADEVVVVVRHNRDRVAAAALAADRDVIIADQDAVKGTGRAVQCGLEAIPEASGAVVVMAGDTPLLDAEILGALLEAHTSAEAAVVTVLTARVPDPFGYGRILRDASGTVSAIVEEKDATPAQREVDEINTSTYAFDIDFLRGAIGTLDTNNAQGEVYLTDVVARAHDAGLAVGSYTVPDWRSAEGANDLVQLAGLRAEMQRRINEGWMRRGVQILDPATTYVDVTVSLAADAVIHPGTSLLGDTVIGRGAQVGPGEFTDAHIGEGAEARHVVIRGAEVAAGSAVPPYSVLAR